MSSGAVRGARERAAVSRRLFRLACRAARGRRRSMEGNALGGALRPHMVPVQMSDAPSAPRARRIPAWGSAPGKSPPSIPSPEGATQATQRANPSALRACPRLPLPLHPVNAIAPSGLSSLFHPIPGAMPRAGMPCRVAADGTHRTCPNVTARRDSRGRGAAIQCGVPTPIMRAAVRARYLGSCRAL